MIPDKCESLGTELEVDVGRGNPWPLSSSPDEGLLGTHRGLTQHRVCTGDRRVLGKCGKTVGPQVGGPEAGLPQGTPRISVFVFGSGL